MFFIHTPVYTQHIGPAFRMSGKTGLRWIMSYFFQQSAGRNGQFRRNSLCQKFHLVITPAEFPQRTHRHPCDHIEALGIFPQDPHRQDSAVAGGIMPGTMELVAEQTPSYIPFIVPDSSETVKKLRIKLSLRIFRPAGSAPVAQVRFFCFQQISAQNTLGRKHTVE